MGGTAQPLSGHGDIHALHNSTFDEIGIGDTATIERKLTSEDIRGLALLSGYAGPRSRIAT